VHRYADGVGQGREDHGTDPNGANDSSSVTITVQPGPSLSSLSLSSSTVRSGRTATLRYRLGAPASVQLRLERVDTRAVRTSSQANARRVATHARRGRKGTNRASISTRVRGRKLAPGTYRVVLTARDRKGRRSGTNAVQLRVLR
jgi:hypothetical protein